jgi:hypothetical protein
LEFWGLEARLDGLTSVYAALVSSDSVGVPRKPKAQLLFLGFQLKSYRISHFWSNHMNDTPPQFVGGGAQGRGVKRRMIRDVLCFYPFPKF